MVFRRVYLFVIMLLTIGCSLSANFLDAVSHLTDPSHLSDTSRITVINHTEFPIWVGVYRLKENLLGNSVGDATLQGPIVQIARGGRADLSRSAFKIKTNRELVFSDIENDIKKKITTNEYKLVSKTPVSMKHGSTFHIAIKDNILHGYSDVEWKIVDPTLSAAKEAFNRTIDDIRQKVIRHPYGRTKAVVRIGPDLALQEVNFLDKRTPKVKEKLEQLLGMSLVLEEVPKIAVCMSGGGMRAATSAMGLFAGLDAIGLLDALTYAAGLSGSTWTLSSFVELGLSMDQYSEHFIKALSKKHIFTPADIAYVLWPKYVFNEHTSIVDLYGVFLAHTFFHNNGQPDKKFRRQDIHLSHAQRRLIDGNCFFPMYTAVQVVRGDRHWATFTPYEFSIDDFKMSIPIWAFGREFKRGESANFAPEQSLGFLMGIWGSALSGGARDMVKKQEGQLSKTLCKALNDVLIETSVAGFKWAAVKVFNPLYGVNNIAIKNLEKITLMDAGYSCNLPLHPLLKKERAVDLIIVLDAGADVHDKAPDFQIAIKDAEAKGFYYDSIDYAAIVDKQINVIPGRDHDTPTILFMAPAKNETYDSHFDPKKEFGTTYNTKNFFYKANDVKKLSGLVRQNVIDNKDLILNAIKAKIEQKRRTSVAGKLRNSKIRTAK